MRIVHRVSLTPSGSQQEKLTSLGVKVKGPGSPLIRSITFVIDENHRAWPEVKSLIKEWNALDFVITEFSVAELDAADFLQLAATWHHGYPQPEEDFGYLKETYDLSDYCQTCGIGLTQIAPFRMKSEPKWGKKHIMQLNWVFDEFFVLPQVWEEVFKPIGVGCSPVREHRTGKELRTVVQLNIKDVAKSALSIKEYPSETCGVCGRKKYLPISRGYFPPFATDPSSQICRTQEYFGSGASAWNAIVVTSDVYRAIQGRKLAGVTFIPVSKRRV